MDLEVFEHKLTIDLSPMRPMLDVLADLKRAAAVIAHAADQWEQSPRDFFGHLMDELEAELAHDLNVREAAG